MIDNFDPKNIINSKFKNQKINYDRVLQELVNNWKKSNFRPKIMIHSCCAPCSTVVLEYLSSVADVTIYFSNSNIHPKEEYEYRKKVQKDFIDDFNIKTGSNVSFMADEYNPNSFFQITKGLENEKEGGARCHLCYRMRLDRSALKASELNFDYFASALTLSPHKNSEIINEVGFGIEKELEVTSLYYLPSDFKKNNGYLRSIEMCKEYDIYRQCYCGCVFGAKQQGIDFKEVIARVRSQLKEE